MAFRDTRYRKITTELEGRIRAGMYAPGTALPPRVELMAEFQVARATIDRCIGELRRKKLVTSRHGSGTFVAKEISGPIHIGVIDGGVSHCRWPEAWEVHHLPGAELVRRSDWNRLLDFDGIIWVRPGEELYPVIAAMHGNVPQVVVNRTVPGEVCVSTDHRGAYFEITRERLDQLPASTAYLLISHCKSLPELYRENGFIDACRAARRFYEVRTMAADFETRLAELRSLTRDPATPLLLVSTSMSNTGSVMTFAREANLEWGRDIFYSDFDNDLSQDCWGRVVTSFIQDEAALNEGAVAELQRQLDGGSSDEKHTLIFPKRRIGET